MFSLKTKPARKGKRFDRKVWLWPLGCIACVVIVWIATFSKIRSERADAEKDIASLAMAYSQAYAEQVDRTISQIEQFTLTLQYYWVKNSNDVSLEEQLLYGIFPRSERIYVTVINRNGKVVTSTLSGTMLNMSREEFFKSHQSFTDSRMRVSDKLVKREGLGTQVLQFSRRLDAEDGSFDGVILVEVEPHYLATFNNEDSLAPSDFISMRHENGSLLVSEKGDDARSYGQVHIEPPRFKALTGNAIVPGSRFKDNEARTLSWHKNNNFPLVSYAGLSHKAHLENHFRTAVSHQSFAAAFSFLLVLVSGLGMYYSIRQRRQEEEAEEVRAAFRLATDAANEGFYMVRPVYGARQEIVDFVYADCNEHGAKLLGRKREQLIGARLGDIVPSSYWKNVLDCYRRAMTEGFYDDEHQTHADSPIRAKWICRRLVRSGEGLAVTLRDISERKAHESTLLNMANIDSLTGLPNRHWLLNFLPVAINQAKTQQTLLAVLFIDLDGFKDVNDSLGHKAGDLLLQSVALRLKSVLRPHDHVVRLGGDEFTVVLTSVSDEEEVVQVAMRINQSLHKPVQFEVHNCLIHASIGIGIYPRDGDTTELLLQNADIAMYVAKDEGKGTFRQYNEQLHTCQKNKRDLANELTQAILEDQFVMHYQPRMDIQSGRLHGMEALVRWQHPERGIVPPNEFLPQAESTGMIVPLGQLILEKVCMQLSLWSSQGEAVVPVSVNISPRQFNVGHVDKVIAELLKVYRLPANLIEVELTESAMMNESSEILEQVATLNAMGITIHLDDFGTGYSSLSRLQEINVQVLKIDRAFTARLSNSQSGKTLFRSIVSMGKSLNMRIVAEGVETMEQLKVLHELSCDEAQGYLLSKPVPAEEALQFIRRQVLLEHYAYV